MNHFDIDRTLETMTLLCDTREQSTKRFKDRIEIIGLPYERRKLDVGDYSCSCILPDGTELDFSQYVVIERKMNIDELCMCFGHDRGRFQREFDRAAASGIKVYLIVEDGTWEKTYNGKYQSKYNSKALVASINAFRARYNMQIDFCKQETTGRMIRDILYRELKEHLEGMTNEEYISGDQT